MVETFDFEFVQGEEFDLIHDIVDDDNINQPDEIENGTTAEWRVSEYPDTQPVLTVEDADITILSYNPGILKFSLDEATTSQLRGSYYHEFEINEPTYGKSVTMYGDIWVEESNDN